MLVAPFILREKANVCYFLPILLQDNKCSPYSFSIQDTQGFSPKARPELDLLEIVRICAEFYHQPFIQSGLLIQGLTSAEIQVLEIQRNYTGASQVSVCAQDTVSEIQSSACFASVLTLGVF